MGTGLPFLSPEVLDLISIMRIYTYVHLYKVYKVPTALNWQDLASQSDSPRCGIYGSRPYGFATQADPTT